MSEEDKKLQKEFKEMEKAYKNMFDNITLEQFKQIKEQVIKNIKSKDKEIDEILDKLSNRKSETLIQGLRECQLKDIEHPFITKEEYIDKLLNYITSLQQKVEQLEKENKILKDTILKALEFINNHTYRWKDTQFGEMVEVEDFEPGLKPIELINILQNIFENK